VGNSCFPGWGRRIRKQPERSGRLAYMPRGTQDRGQREVQHRQHIQKVTGAVGKGARGGAPFLLNDPGGGRSFIRVLILFRVANEKCYFPLSGRGLVPLRVKGACPLQGGFPLVVMGRGTSPWVPSSLRRRFVGSSARGVGASWASTGNWMELGKD